MQLQKKEWKLEKSAKPACSTQEHYHTVMPPQAKNSLVFALRQLNRKWNERARKCIFVFFFFLLPVVPYNIALAFRFPSVLLRKQLNEQTRKHSMRKQKISEKTREYFCFLSKLCLTKDFTQTGIHFGKKNASSFAGER